MPSFRNSGSDLDVGPDSTRESWRLESLGGVCADVLNENCWDWEEDVWLHCVSDQVVDQLREESDSDGTERLFAQNGQIPRLASSFGVPISIRNLNW